MPWTDRAEGRGERRGQAQGGQKGGQGAHPNPWSLRLKSLGENNSFPLPKRDFSEMPYLQPTFSLSWRFNLSTLWLWASRLWFPFRKTRLSTHPWLPSGQNWVRTRIWSVGDLTGGRTRTLRLPTRTRRIRRTRRRRSSPLNSMPETRNPKPETLMFVCPGGGEGVGGLKVEEG